MTIKIQTLKTLPTSSGVYFFLSSSAEVIYVGKAKNIKNRVGQYFQKKVMNKRIQQLVSQIDKIEVLCTDSEHAALVLENQMIKKHKPRYNVLLKDDKSYPYIYLTHHDFPRVGICRGKKSKNCSYYGPYTSIRNLRYLLDVMQKLFKVRTCNESYFKNRSRACLLHQIGRCHGPCVAHIDKQSYAEEVKALKQFLAGNYQTLISEYADKMHQAAKEQSFEKAALYRDTITGLQNLIAQQEQSSQRDCVDFIAAKDDGVSVIIQHLWIRNGQIQDSKPYMMGHAALELDDILSSFIKQYYTNTHVPLGLPDAVVCMQLDDNFTEVASYLSDNCKKTLRLTDVLRKQNYKHWARVVENNLQASYLQQMQKKHRFTDAFDGLSTILQDSIDSVECIDISHTQGSNTYASCVYFNRDGPVKPSYRTYKLENKNDDYASMRATIERRYHKKKSKQHADVLLIDGGRGQLNAVAQVIAAYDHISVYLLAIAKDSTRTSGLEKYFIWDKQGLTRQVNIDVTTRRLLETVRDEAHRFAIKQHRGARSKTAMKDVILELEGIGPKRYHQLLSHFGGINGIKKASVKQLQLVPGISKQLAEKIHLSMMQ